MTIKEKYNLIRSKISDGDLILFHGTGIIAKIIRFCDSSYYSHIGVIVEKHGSLFIVDANADGVQADRLSWRISKYNKNSNFVIIQSKDNFIVPPCMSKLLKRSDNKWIKYDFKNGIKELLNRKFGFKLNIKLSDNKAICSSNVAQYVIDLGIMNEKFNELKIAFPEDYIRFVNKNKINIIN